MSRFMSGLLRVTVGELKRGVNALINSLRRSGSEGMATNRALPSAVATPIPRRTAVIASGPVAYTERPSVSAFSASLTKVSISSTAFISA